MTDRRLCRRFWDSLSYAQLLPLAAAVFCLFGAPTLVLDAVERGRLHPLALASLALLNGGLATGCMLALLRRRYRLLASVAAVYLLGVFGTERVFAASGARVAAATGQRVGFDLFGTIALLVGSYALFLLFINREGVRHAHTRAEIDLAREIHESLVPPVSLQTSWCEILGRSLPANEVGGDLVDALLVARRPVAFVADVSGHGVAAGTAMGLVKAGLRMRLRTSGDPDYILADLNDVLAQLVRPSTFVTAALLTLESPTRLAYALAGHPPILHWRRRTCTVARLCESAMALGIRPGERYQLAHVEVEPGDLLAVLTDGMTETMDAQGRELGIEPLERVLRGAADEPLPALFDRLLEAAQSHGAQHDDRTLLLLRVRAVAG